MCKYIIGWKNGLFVNILRHCPNIKLLPCSSHDLASHSKHALTEFN